MLRPCPIVQFDVLHYQASDQHAQILINTPAWYAWLTEASSFTFVNEYGMFFAYKEHTGNQRGGWYWRASCRREGKLRRAYLGKAENLSLERLEEVARVLTLAPAQGEDQPKDLTPLIPQAMRDSLLATKLHVPGLRPRLVPRPGLTQRLQSNWEKPLLLLSAPAGFGKSTLLAEWLAESPIPTAWLSLEAQENRPERFLTYLIAALQTLFPRFGKNALTLLSSLNTPVTTASSEEMLTLLLNEVIGSKFPPFLLILHDYHVITAKQVHEAVTFLLHHLPAQMHLLLATREDPPLPLARLRSENALYELRAADLRFSPEETRAFLLDVMALPLAPEQCLRLHTRTEGWITGLQLAVLAMQGRDDLSAFVQDFTGNHHYIMDYILQEVLERQTEDMRAFLVQTSLLERLNASLCNAVCKREDSQYLLEQLEHTNLFTIPLDDQHQWFRYHQLFAEVLRHCLQRTFPTLILELHQRAHDWYMRAALFAQAKYHANAVQELEGVPTYPDAMHIEPLTERESDVLRLLMEGADNRAIARELVLSVNTVKKHIVHLYAKLHVQNRGQAIARAMMVRR